MNTTTKTATCSNPADLLVALIDEIASSKSEDPHSAHVCRRVEAAPLVHWVALAAKAGVELTDDVRAEVVEVYRARVAATAAPSLTFRVRYYDARMSRKGQGVQVRTFTDRAKAEDFASQNRIYAGPCRVEAVSL